MGKFKPEYTRKLKFYILELYYLINNARDSQRIVTILYKRKSYVVEEHVLNYISKLIKANEYKSYDNVTKKMEGTLSNIE